MTKSCRYDSEKKNNCPGAIDAIFFLAEGKNAKAHAVQVRGRENSKENYGRMVEEIWREPVEGKVVWIYPLSDTIDAT